MNTLSTTNPTTHENDTFTFDLRGNHVTVPLLRKRNSEDTKMERERERAHTHTYNKRSSVTNMQDFLLGNSDDGGGGRAEKLQALIRRADSDPPTEECDR